MTNQITWRRAYFGKYDLWAAIRSSHGYNSAKQRGLVGQEGFDIYQVK